MNMCLCVVILILYMFLFPLCWIISYPTCGKWSPTLLWCRLTGWGHIVDVSFPRTTWRLLIFLFILLTYVQEHWVHFH